MTTSTFGFWLTINGQRCYLGFDRDANGFYVVAGNGERLGPFYSRAAAEEYAYRTL
jgi:hypothetical protein